MWPNSVLHSLAPAILCLTHALHPSGLGEWSQDKVKTRNYKATCGSLPSPGLPALLLLPAITSPCLTDEFKVYRGNIIPLAA